VLVLVLAVQLNQPVMVTAPNFCRMPQSIDIQHREPPIGVAKAGPDAGRRAGLVALRAGAAAFEVIAQVVVR
jgi:hypothetical protein